jgi:hypothetical protein
MIDVEKEKRDRRNVLNLQKIHGGFSTCNRCGLPWPECKNKSIKSGPTSGVFAMCTYCWNVSDLEERLHHFKTLWYEHKNRSDHHYDWSIVEENIRTESAIK